mmetsp:Transcript_31/g.70  ORF Transcript_31/g.70 Transcript_31/m.70 type:complete len:103 (+) Transcript_31:142-450(+)
MLRVLAETSQGNATAIFRDELVMPEAAEEHSVWRPLLLAGVPMVLLSTAMLAAYHRFKERRRRSALILSANRLVDVWSGMHLTVRSVRTSQAGEKLRTTEQV